MMALYGASVWLCEGVSSGVWVRNDNSIESRSRSMRNDMLLFGLLRMLMHRIQIWSLTGQTLKFGWVDPVQPRDRI